MMQFARSTLCKGGIAIICCAALFVPAKGQVTERISLDSLGGEGNGNSLRPSISADGRYIAFVSYADNFGLGDTNLAADVFVHDTQTGSTERVSVDSTGSTGNSDSLLPSISGDGRFVAFGSAASNLVPSDTNGLRDIFVRDRLLGTTVRVSVDSLGSQGNGISDGATISADGRYVAFHSFATNLVAGDTNGWVDIFVHDRQSGTTERANVDSGGIQANRASVSPSLSADGRYLAFESFATNLATGDTNGRWDIFVRDRLAAITDRTSVDALGTQANGDSFDAHVSSDGRFVVFESVSTNLVLGDTNARQDIFVRDRLLGLTSRASVNSSGVEGNDDSYDPSVSADGRYIAFGSRGSNLVASDTNAAQDGFIHDTLNGTIERISLGSTAAQGDGDSLWVSTASDGQRLAFESDATNLVPSDTNGKRDVFVRDRRSRITTYCIGHGGTISCPCGNNGGAGGGCPNSAFATGALLIGAGTANVASDTLAFGASELTGSVAVFFQGATSVSATVIDDGLGCVGGPIIRLGAKPVTGNTSSFPQAGDPLISVRGAVPPSGGTYYYQCFYRNAVAAFCPPATSNRTNGLAVTWVP